MKIRLIKMPAKIVSKKSCVLAIDLVSVKKKYDSENSVVVVRRRWIAKALWWLEGANVALHLTPQDEMITW